MAEFRQGYLDDYSQNNTGVGIGTSSPTEAKLEIVGGTTSQELNVTGISTFTHVSGFIKKHTDYAENVNITAGDSGTLSGEIIVGAGLTMTVGTSVTTSQGSVDSLKVFNMFQPPSGTTNTRPVGKPGALFYNFDFKTIEFFDGNSWRQVDNVIRRGRGLYCGGWDGTNRLKSIEFIEVSTLGDAQNFGDLTVAREGCGRGTISSAIRGLSMAGWDGSGTNEIDYLTIASGGNSIDFGNSSNARGWGAGMSSSTRGLLAGGYNPSTVNVIDYVEIMTLGDALDFGDLATQKESTVGMSNPTRGFIGPGMSPSFVSEIDVITIASKGDSTAFGDMDSTRGLAAAANTTRGLFAGGKGPDVQNLERIFFITMASTGNATDFGNLTQGRRKPEGVTNSTRACFGGGNLEPSGRLNRIDFVTISSAGNAADFGDLSLPREVGNSNSDSHGGLGGF